MKLSNQLHHHKSSYCQLSFRWQVISIYQQRASWQGVRNDNLAWTVKNIFSRISKAETPVYAWGYEQGQSRAVFEQISLFILHLLANIEKYFFQIAEGMPLIGNLMFDLFDRLPFLLYVYFSVLFSCLTHLIPQSFSSPLFHCTTYSGFFGLLVTLLTFLFLPFF